MWQCHTLLKTRPLSLSLRARLLTEVKNRASVGLCRVCCSTAQVPPAPTSAVITNGTAARSMPKVSPSAPILQLPPPRTGIPLTTTPMARPCSRRRAWAVVIQVSERVLATDEPVIGKTKALMEGVDGVLSLAQGPHLHPWWAAHASPSGGRSVLYVSLCVGFKLPVEQPIACCSTLHRFCASASFPEQHTCRSRAKHI